MNNNLQERIMTALVLIPTVLAAVWYLPSLYFRLLIGAVVAIASWEWAKLMGLSDVKQKLTFVLLIIALGVFLWHMPLIYVTAVASLGWVVSLWLLRGFPDNQSRWYRKLVTTCMGALILMPWWLVLADLQRQEHGKLLILFIFSIVWLSDTSAYFIGKKWGKTLMVPRLSPKKTSAGFFAALASGLLLGLIVAVCLRLPGLNVVIFSLITVVTVFFAIVSDLVESMMKRAAGVKDSGAILPGHGGVLDRIDSLLAAVPIFFLLNSMFMHGINDARAVTQSEITATDLTIVRYLNPAKQVHFKSTQQRVMALSEQLIGKPYLRGQLGEGQSGRYDQQPRYRMDGFDCVTFVETVLALSHANSLPAFQHHMLALRYADGQPKFTHRNIVTSVDWNPNNSKKGYVTDITRQFIDSYGQPVYKTATAPIDKAGWYRHLTGDAIHCMACSQDERALRLSELKSQGKKEPRTISHLDYLPLDRLFSSKGVANHKLFKQFPAVSIIEIVRPNWSIQKRIGTHLNVSHLGFVIRRGNELVFRHASSATGYVTDVSFITYLRNTIKSPTIRGIHVLAL